MKTAEFLSAARATHEHVRNERTGGIERKSTNIVYYPREDGRMVVCPHSSWIKHIAESEHDGVTLIYTGAAVGCAIPVRGSFDEVLEKIKE